MKRLQVLCLLGVLSVTGCPPSSSTPQQALHEALVPLCRALPQIAGQAELLHVRPEEAGPLVQALLEPHRARLATASKLYQGLDQRQRLAVFARAAQACQPEMRNFYLALAKVLGRIKNEEQAREFVAPTVRHWRASQALWAFGLFARDTVEELEHMADEDDEKEKGKSPCALTRQTSQAGPSGRWY